MARRHDVEDDQGDGGHALEHIGRSIDHEVEALVHAAERSDRFMNPYGLPGTVALAAQADRGG